MSKIWYLSPSNQSTNVGINGYGTEKEQMKLLVEEIVPHLDRAGAASMWVTRITVFRCVQRNPTQ